MSSSSAPLRRRLITLARVLLAVLILGWVATGLPWSDTLTFTDGKGNPIEVKGEILGDWEDDLVRFVPDEPSEVDERWPLGAREPLARKEPILAKRRAEGEAGFDWLPGMPHAFRTMDMSVLVVSEVLFLVATLTIVTRWWRLLALADCPTSWSNALRLTFLGLFFNNVIPGATGGDLVKGVMVAKENPGRGADAVVTVLVDRIFGMVALAMVALAVILLEPFVRRDSAPRPELAELRTWLLWGLVLCVACTALYASKKFRRLVGLSALVDRLPLGEKLRSLDRAAMLYLKRPVPVAIAFLFSFVNHALVTFAVYLLGGALGVPRSQVSLTDYFVLVPVANLISAVPLAPGGWGVGELAFRGLFLMIHANPALGVAVSVTFRLSQLGIGLLGGIFLLLPGNRLDLRAERATAP